MGILEFVFGKGTPKDDTAPKEAFYLNDDDAKTFGNIDYMRSNKVVRRTFAKKKGQAEHLESVRQISSMAAQVIDNNSGYQKASQTQPTFGSSSAPASKQSEQTNSNSSTSSSASSASTSSRRKPSSSDMDMFRNMAKDIRK